MADVATPASAAASAIAPSAAVQQVASMVIEVYGYHFNLMGLSLAAIGLAVLFLFYRIQASQKLDFADMITKDGKSVSLTKVLQLVGGITSTWIMVKLTLTGGLTEALFGLYLTYVGAIEGYSKYVAAKYGYKEGSVKDVAAPTDDSKDK